jgi:hypothetical protein
MKLPRVLRAARQGRSSLSIDDQLSTFNAGMRSPGYFDLPDALRGNVRITGPQTAQFAQIEQAARNGSTRRRG